jgi:hypothetical protein
MHDLGRTTIENSAVQECSLWARRSGQQETLQELFESPEFLNEGLLSLSHPLFIADDEEWEDFLGGLIRRASRAVSGVAKTVGRTPLVRGVSKTVGSVAKTVGKGISAVDKVVPVSMLTSAVVRTPIGLAFRAGLGAMQAAADGRNVFQGAMRSMTGDLATRFLVDTGMASGTRRECPEGCEAGYAGRHW